MFNDFIAYSKIVIVGWYMYFSELWQSFVDVMERKDDDNWPPGGCAA